MNEKEISMPKVNISLPKDEMERFKKISEEERRSYNQQLMHMMDFYLKYKDKVK